MSKRQPVKTGRVGEEALQAWVGGAGVAGAKAQRGESTQLQTAGV